MPEHPVIRRAALTDAPELAELSRALGYPVDAIALAGRLERLMDRFEDVILIAESDSRIVGWIQGTRRELLVSQPLCEIVGLVVEASCRRQGIGRRLVEAVEAWADKRGLGEVAVRSNVVRGESHPFYERLGYRRIKTQHAYRKPLP